MRAEGGELLARVAMLPVAVGWELPSALWLAILWAAEAAVEGAEVVRWMMRDRGVKF